MSRQLTWLWGGVSVLLVALSPWADGFASALWGCVFKGFTGFACPTCGTARAALALARFDVAGALTSFPLQSLGWIFVVGGGLLCLVAVSFGRTPPAFPKSLSPATRVAVVAAVALNWAYSIATGV